MQMKGIVNVAQKTDEETWSLTKFLNSLLGKTEVNDKSLDAHNIYSEKADFSNDYGWSIEVDGDDYEPLKLSDFAVYLVNLTAVNKLYLQLKGCKNMFRLCQLLKFMLC